MAAEDRPEIDGTLNAPRRRLLHVAVVVGAILVWCVYTAAAVLGDDFLSVPWRWTALAMFVAAWQAGRFLIRDIAERRESTVDEYEAVLRHHTREVVFWVMIGVGVALYVVLSRAVDLAESGDPELLYRAPDLVSAGLFAVAALPTLLLTWTTRRWY